VGLASTLFCIGGLGLLIIAVLGLVVPGQRYQPRQDTRLVDIRKIWQQLRHERPALGMLGFIFFAGMANDTLFVVYGAWLENSFALGLVALGTATTVIGVAELIGETLTATLADWVGLKQSIQIGLVLTVLSYVFLPIVGSTLPLALAGLFITFLAFEFTIVTNASLITEILPNARATMISAGVAASGLGRVVGAFIGGPAWLLGGILATGLVSAGLSLVALAFFTWGLRRWQV